jgi:hypothetical protein
MHIIKLEPPSPEGKPMERRSGGRRGRYEFFCSPDTEILKVQHLRWTVRPRIRAARPVGELAGV